MKILSENQQKEITKISEFTSFASHITERYNNDLKQINKNTEHIIEAIESVVNKIDILQLVDLEIQNVQKFHEQIKIFERTNNLDSIEMPNIEILTIEELLQIYQHLLKLYEKEQLISIDNAHPFEILLF